MLVQPAYAYPPQGAPEYIQPQAPQPIRVPESNTFSFVPDAYTRSLIEKTYPELTNAFINIAIKKFSEETDYVDYFLKEEFKNSIEVQKIKAKVEVPAVPAPAAAAIASFSNWG